MRCVLNWVKSVELLISTIPSQATGHPVEGVETTGGKMGFLNNQQECPRQLYN